jgi:hypothetical protein
MSVRSPIYVLAFVFCLALLILIISLGAIVAISFRNRRSGFSYFAGGMRSCSHAAATGEQA